MFAWPTLELTDYERKYVRIYKTAGKPGVLNRRYDITLNSQADPTKNLPVIKTSGNIQIARRSRVYALTFAGNTDRWRLGITTASGTQFTNKSNRSFLDPVVTCLVPGNFQNAMSLGGATPPLIPGTTLTPGIGPAINPDSLPYFVQGSQPFPLLIEPNWVLTPNEALIFNGTPIPISFRETAESPVLNLNLILRICVHVWEFPDMGVADKATREVI